MNLYAKNELERLLEKNGFFFKKNLGQNFLMNEPTAEKIAAAARETVKTQKKCLAVEIGPGAGALTVKLSDVFDKVICLELDPHLIPVLAEALEGRNNVEVVCCDALTYPYAILRESYPDWEIAVCSNLPYYITSEAIMTLLESNLALTGITVLIQKEAAARLVSQPGSPDYGAITASVSYYAEAARLFTAGPGNFLPRPKVDSAVLRLIPRQEKPVCPLSEETFFRVIRAAFAARRKTVLNALTVAFGDSISKDKMAKLLLDRGIDPARRGETLTLEEFCAISDSIFTSEDV